MARPLYVERAYHLDEPAHVPVLGNIRSFSAVRGWGLIYPDGRIDAVFFRSSEFTLSDGQAIADLAADQRRYRRVLDVFEAGSQATPPASRTVERPCPRMVRRSANVPDDTQHDVNHATRDKLVK